jgi:hypothetical protein
MGLPARPTHRSPWGLAEVSYEPFAVGKHMLSACARDGRPPTAWRASGVTDSEAGAWKEHGKGHLILAGPCVGLEPCQS